MRSRLRALLIGLAVAGLALLAFSSVDRVPLDTMLEFSGQAEERIPDLVQRLRRFHRVVTRHGERLLEVSATEASYYRDDRAVVVVEPKLVFYDQGVRIGTLSGQHGRLYLEGHEVETVELEGEVELALAQFTLRTERLDYERSRELLIAPQHAVISSPEIELSGSGLAFDLVTRALRLDSEVRMRLIHAPESPAGEFTVLREHSGEVISSVAAATRGFRLTGLGADLTITAERMEFDYSAGRISYVGDVRVTHGDAVLEAPELTILLDPSNPRPLLGVTASGGVQMTRGNETAWARMASYQREEGTITLAEEARLGSGPNSVTGERIIFHIGQGRTVVEGGSEPVRAVLQPGTLAPEELSR